MVAWFLKKEKAAGNILTASSLQIVEKLFFNTHLIK